MKRQSSSAASMNLKSGINQPGQKLRVEGGKWVSTEELKRSVIEGVRYFNSRRPPQYHVI